MRSFIEDILKTHEVKVKMLLSGVSRVFFNSSSTQQKYTEPQISNAIFSHLHNNNKILYKSLQQQMANNTLQLKKTSFEFL